MTTLFDIGDEIEMTVKGKIRSYSCEKKEGILDDCFVIEMEPGASKGSYSGDFRLYMSTDMLMAAEAKKVEKEEKNGA